MNLVTMTNGEATVTSRQVAETFKKNLDKVHRSIALVKAAIDVTKFGEMFAMTSYEDTYGRTQTEYTMNRDGWTLLTMGFNGANAMQWKIKYIDAFNAMERQLINPLELLPKTYPEAMRLLADTYEAKDALEAQVIAMTPKARAFDVFIDSKGYYSVGTAAKMLGMGRNGLYVELRYAGLLMDDNVPYQRYINEGIFVVKGAPSHHGVTYVSAKGVRWLSEKLVA